MRSNHKTKQVAIILVVIFLMQMTMFSQPTEAALTVTVKGHVYHPDGSAAEGALVQVILKTGPVIMSTSGQQKSGKYEPLDTVLGQDYTDSTGYYEIQVAANQGSLRYQVKASYPGYIIYSDTCPKRPGTYTRDFPSYYPTSDLFHPHDNAITMWANIIKGTRTGLNAIEYLAETFYFAYLGAMDAGNINRDYIFSGFTINEEYDGSFDSIMDPTSSPVFVSDLSQLVNYVQYVIDTNCYNNMVFLMSALMATNVAEVLPVRASDAYGRHWLVRFLFDGELYYIDSHYGFCIKVGQAIPAHLSWANINIDTVPCLPADLDNSML